MMPNHLKVCRYHLQSFRSRLRDNIVKAGPAQAYGLKGVKAGSAEAIAIVNSILPHSIHCKPGSAPGTGYFQNDFLQPAACKMLFSGHKPLRHLYPKKFEKFPLKTVTIMCAIIHGVLEGMKVDPNAKKKKRSSPGEPNQDKLYLATVQEYYRIHHKSTCSFEQYQTPHCNVVLPALYWYCIENLVSSAAPIVQVLKKRILVLTAEHFTNNDLSPEELAKYQPVPARPPSSELPPARAKLKPRPHLPPNDKDDEVEGWEDAPPPTVANSPLNKTVADKSGAMELKENGNTQVLAAPACKPLSATTPVLASPFAANTKTPTKCKRKAALIASVSPEKRKHLAESKIESPSCKQGAQSNSDAVSTLASVSTMCTVSASDFSKSPASHPTRMSVVIPTKAGPGE
ncbi:hypothetical protein RSAG8_11791, partial [Rhizoctonia solani AG-8 WAC10335]